MYLPSVLCRGNPQAEEPTCVRQRGTADKKIAKDYRSSSWGASFSRVALGNSDTCGQLASHGRKNDISSLVGVVRSEVESQSRFAIALRYLVRFQDGDGFTLRPARRGQPYWQLGFGYVG